MTLIQRNNHRALLTILLPCIAIATSLHAAPVTLRWSVDVARPAPAEWAVYRGETVNLEPQFTSYGQALSPSNHTATLYWQTAGMDDDWWSAPAQVLTDPPAGRVRATWNPTNDVGATVYNYFIGLQSADESTRQYRAHGKLRMRHAPGWVPNEIDLPPRMIDFATVTIRNERWLEIESDPVALPIATQALAVATAAATPADIQTAIDAIEIPEIDISSLTAAATGGYRNQVKWSVEIEPRYRVINTAATNVVGDLIRVDVVAGAGLVDAQASVRPDRGDISLVDAVWTASPTNLASIAADGSVTALAPGVVTVQAAISNDLRTARYYARYSTGETSFQTIAAVTNSVRYAATAAIQSAVTTAQSAGRLPTAYASPYINYWQTIDHASATYARNTNAWVDLDFSGLVVATTRDPDGQSGWGDGEQWHGTLVTPRHILMAKQCVVGGAFTSGFVFPAVSQPELVGTWKRWVGRSGTIYHRQVVAHIDPHAPDGNVRPARIVHLGDTSIWSLIRHEDVVIGVLDSDLPEEDIAIYPVLPDDWPTYLPNALDRAIVGSWSQGGSVWGYWSGADWRVNAADYLVGIQRFYAHNRPSSPPQYLYHPGRPADRGRPTFLYLPDTGLILIHQITGKFWGPNPAFQAPGESLRAAIDAAIAPSGHALTQADLTAYTVFGE